MVEELRLERPLPVGPFLLAAPRADAPPGLSFERRGERDARSDGVTLITVARNVSDRPVVLDRLSPFAVAGRGAVRLGALDVLALPSARALRVGWSNIVPPLPIGLRDCDDRAIAAPWVLRLWPAAARAMVFDPDGPPASAPGRLTSAWFTVLRGEVGGPALAVGFAGFRRQLGRVHVRLGERGAEVRAEVSLDGRTLAPGESIELEPLALAWGRDAHAAIAAWARAAGARAGARPRAVRAWCTWYAAPGDRIDERFVASCAAALARRRAPVEHAIVDDGWQRAIGDWTATNERFPRGLAAFAASIREAGLRAGIWLAPFAVSPRSRLFREHPDWVVARPDGSGRPLTAGAIASLRHLPRRYFALDLTREDVLAHLESTIRTLREAGFDLFKIDFLTAGAVRGARADPRRTRAEAYAAGMAALRRGAGDTILLGAIAPFVANAGFVDAQRVGTDVALGRPRFASPLAVRLGGDRMAPSVRNALPGTLALAALDGRLFANDGDCAVARGLPLPLARALSRANLLLCGARSLGDDPRAGPPDAISIAQALGERPAGEVPVLDILDRDLPERVGAERFPWGRLARKIHE